MSRTDPSGEKKNMDDFLKANAQRLSRWSNLKHVHCTPMAHAQEFSTMWQAIKVGRFSIFLGIFSDDFQECEVTLVGGHAYGVLLVDALNESKPTATRAGLFMVESLVSSSSGEHCANSIKTHLVISFNWDKQSMTNVDLTHDLGTVDVTTRTFVFVVPSYVLILLNLTDDFKVDPQRFKSFQGLIQTRCLGPISIINHQNPSGQKFDELRWFKPNPIPLTNDKSASFF